MSEANAARKKANARGIDNPHGFDLEKTKRDYESKLESDPEFREAEWEREGADIAAETAKEEKFGVWKSGTPQDKRMLGGTARTALVVAPDVPDSLNRNLIGVGLSQIAMDALGGKVLGAGLGAGLGLAGKVGKGSPWPPKKKVSTKEEPPTLPGTAVADEDEFYKRLAATEKGGSQWFTGNEAVEQTPEFKKFSEGLRVRDAGTPELIDDEGAVIRAFHGTGGKIIGGL